MKNANFLVDLWVKSKDIYSDVIYWRNSVNGNITYDQPSIYYYLPPNFDIPQPPPNLPAGLNYYYYYYYYCYYFYYLPPNFDIPQPPPNLPAGLNYYYCYYYYYYYYYYYCYHYFLLLLLVVASDIPLVTSSSEDSNAEDWLNRYEAKQRKKREERKLLEYALHSRTARSSDRNDVVTSRSEVMIVDQEDDEDADYVNYNGDGEAEDQRKDLVVHSTEEGNNSNSNNNQGNDNNNNNNQGNHNLAVKHAKSRKPRYDHLFDDSEEIYIGAASTKASEQLQAAVTQATEYMKNNELYLASQAALAVGGSGGAHQIIGMHVYMNVCMYVYMYTCMYECMYACMYVCMYECMYVCINVYINACL